MPENALTRASNGSGGIDASIYSQQKLVNPFDDYSQAVQVARQVQGLKGQQFDLAQGQIKATHDALSSLLTDPSQDNLMARVADLKAAGIPDEAIQRNLGEFQAAGSNAAAIKAIALRHLSAFSTVRERLEQAGMSAPDYVNTGGQVLPLARGSGANQGTVQTGPGFDMTMTPGEKTEMVPSTDPVTGQPRTTPKGAIFGSGGEVRSIPVVRPGARGAAAQPGQAGQPNAPAGPTPPALPAQPGATSAPAQPSAPAGAGPSAAAGPGASAPAPSTAYGLPLPPQMAAGESPQAQLARTGSLGAGLAPAQSADMKASIDAFNAARDDIKPSQDRSYALGQAINALRETNTGPGTSGRQQLVSAIYALPGDIGKKLLTDDQAKSLSSYDVAKKLLTGIQMSRPGAGRSDASLATSAASSPNVEGMSNPAAIEVALSMAGQERMNRAHAQDYLKGKGDPGQFSNFRAGTYAQASDPHAYALPHMTPAERTRYINGLSGPAKAKFLASVRLGLRSGELTRDDLQGANDGQ